MVESEGKSNVLCFRKSSVEFTDSLNDAVNEYEVPATVMVTCESDDIMKSLFTPDDNFRVTVFIPVGQGDTSQPDQRCEFLGFAEPRQIIVNPVIRTVTLTRTIYSGSEPQKARTAKFVLNCSGGGESNIEEIAWKVFQRYYGSVAPQRRSS